MTALRLVVVTALAFAAGAVRADEEVLFLQTRESPEVSAECPGQNIRLGAFVFAPRTRAWDGRVQAQRARPIGTAVGCGTLTTVTPGSRAPFHMTFDLGGRRIDADGECTVADWFFPIPGTPAPVLLVGCTLAVAADESQGLLEGIAASASVFLPSPIPGYGTGSFWTLHLYTRE